MGAESGSRERLGVLFVNTRSGLGADVAVHALIASHLDPVRCDVWFATNREAPDKEDLLALLDSGGRPRVLEMDFGTELTGLKPLPRVLRAAGNAAKMGLAAIRLAGLTRREKIAVLHVTDRPRDVVLSRWVSRLSGARTLLHLHIQWTPEMDRVTQAAAVRADGLLAISRFVERSMIEGGLPQSKVYVALNAVDAHRFDPDRVARGALRKRLGLDDATPLAGIVGRVLPWKGHIDLVEAWKRVAERMPNAHLAICGPAFAHSRAFREEVNGLIEKLGLKDRIHWAGWWRKPEEAIADLDVVVVPSFEEPFGLIVIEAMSMQKPVVGYESGALPEILVSGREGLLVPPRDTKSLAQSVTELLADPQRRSEMGMLGRRRVLEAFLPERQAADVEAIYRRVAAGSGSAARGRSAGVTSL